MKKIIAACAAISISLSLLVFIIDIAALSEGLMLRLMVRCAPPESTQLPAEEYEPVVRMIVSYLKGDRPDFQHFFTADGVTYAAFNAWEQQHMADVQGLFRLCDGQVWMLIAIAAAAMLAELRLYWEESLLRAFRRTLLCVLGIAAGIAVLACADFDGVFTLFHRIAFTNDLWLLDPRTDLLIRLMPSGFFVRYAALIGGLWLAGMGILLGLVSRQMKTLRPKEGE